jgi:uncharacterized protein YhbP (UPF0306 family)
MIEPPMQQNQRSSEDEWRRQAMALMDRQKTLVLATSDRNRPWTAPVYYVRIEPAFYFFSSPQSKHITQAMKNSVTAAAVYSEADQWQQLEGVQMVGRIKTVRKKLERIKATARYLKKFPMARSILTEKANNDIGVGAKASLYAFYPESVFYMNNQMGFGARMELDL